MDIARYSESLRSYDFDGLKKIKQESIPKKLYKYVPLGLSPSEDEKRFKTLESTSLWFSPVSEYNDTNEFQGLYVSDRKLAEEGWSPDHIFGIHEIVEAIGGKALVCCLSAVGYDNEPMWAYYANNSRGYCIEYKVDDPRYLREVQYESCAREITHTAASLYCNTLNNLKTHKLTNEDRASLELISMRTQIKHSSWNHEKEYRFVIPVDLSEGASMTISELGLSVCCVYAGVGCEEGDFDRMRGIGEELGFPVEKLEPFDLGFRSSCH